MGDSEYRYSK